MSKPSNLEVDRRVAIALSVLSPAQKESVNNLLRSAHSFAAAADVPGRVQQLRNSGQPLFLLRVTQSLRLVFTLVGDTVYVVDLIEHATLKHFAKRKVATAKGGGKKLKASSREASGASH